MLKQLIGNNLRPTMQTQLNEISGMHVDVSCMQKNTPWKTKWSSPLAFNQSISGFESRPRYQDGGQHRRAGRSYKPVVAADYRARRGLTPRSPTISTFSWYYKVWGRSGFDGNAYAQEARRGFSISPVSRNSTLQMQNQRCWQWPLLPNSLGSRSLPQAHMWEAGR